MLKWEEQQRLQLYGQHCGQKKELQPFGIISVDQVKVTIKRGMQVSGKFSIYIYHPAHIFHLSFLIYSLSGDCRFEVGMQ